MKTFSSRRVSDLEWIDNKIQAVEAKPGFLKQKGEKLKRLLSAQQQQDTMKTEVMELERTAKKFAAKSTQYKLHRTCCTLQSLHLTLQWPMACPGLAAHTLAGLCVLWLPSGASFTEKLEKAAKPQPAPQTTCPALRQHPASTQPHLLRTAESAFDLAVAQDIPRAGHTHIGRAVCAVVGEQRLLH